MSVGDSLIPADGAFVGKKVSVRSVKRRILPEFSDQEPVAIGVCLRVGLPPATV